MKTTLKNIWSYIRASYWFIPIVMAILSMTLAFSLTYLDWWLNKLGYDNNALLLANQPEGARAILSTIAGSMITVAGVTFSITIMAVSFALGQIGPRLIHNFMRDRVNQYTLGTFIATFLYSLLVLRLVLNGNEISLTKAFVPHIAVFTAILLAIFNIGVFIFFIHHIAYSLNVYNILATIADELNKMIIKIYPKVIDDSDNQDCNTKEINSYNNWDLKVTQIYSLKEGYVRIIGIKNILAFSIENDCIIEVKVKPGDFVTPTIPIIFVNKCLNEDNINQLQHCIAVGRERDQSHDFLLLSDEIAEIIARALSPSVNDPFTAITAINWLQTTIELFSKRQPSPNILYDEYNKPRLIISPITLQIYVHRIFGQIFPYISKDRNTILHMIIIMKEILKRTSSMILITLINEAADKFTQMSTGQLLASPDKELYEKNYYELKNIYGEKMKKVK